MAFFWEDLTSELEGEGRVQSIRPIVDDLALAFRADAEAGDQVLRVGGWECIGRAVPRRAKRLPKELTLTSTPRRSWRPEQGGGRADERRVLLVRPPRGMVLDLEEIRWLVLPRMLVDASGIYEAVQERKAGRASAAPDEPRPRTKAKLCQREPWSRRAAGARGMGTSCALRHAGRWRRISKMCMF